MMPSLPGQPRVPGAEGRATCCPSGSASRAWSGSPRSLPRATAISRSRRRCSSRRRSSSGGVGEVTDVVEKELFRDRAARRGRRALGAPAGADGRHRPRLHPARDADVAAAGEAHDDRADVPLRPAAGRPLPPVLAVRRRGDRRSRAGGRRRDHRARAPVLSRGGPCPTSRGPAQLDRRPGLPAGLRRGAHGVLPGARRDPAGARARPARDEPVAAPRFEGARDGRAQRRGTQADRPPVRCLCEHFAAVRAHLDAIGVAYRLEPASSAVSTTTRDRVRVLSPRAARASSRRSVAAAGTTGSWSSSAAGRRRASGSGWASTGCCWRSRSGAARRDREPAARGRRRRRPGGHRRAPAGRDGAARGGPLLGPSWPEAGPAARGRGSRGRAFRGDPGRRAGRRPGPAARPRGRDAAASCRSRDLVRELRAGEASHRHG